MTRTTNRTTNISLVCTDMKRALLDWSRANLDDSRVVTAWNPQLCREAITMAQDEMDIELKRVVLDQCSDLEQFVEMVAWLGPEFRGDIVMISSPEHGYLSAAGSRDGRVMYKLDSTDIDFYLEAFGLNEKKRAELRLVS